jgi:hypothetical protein
MNKLSRKELNDIINNIKYWDYKLDNYTKDLSCKLEWDVIVDSHEAERLNLELAINRIWYRNLDKKTQRSCNFYRRKGGIPTKKITAIM